MKNMGFALAMMAAPLLLTTSAANAAQCADRGHIVQKLADNFGETFQGRHNQRNAVLELFASRHSESWTLLLSMKDGRSCLVASGQGFSDLDPRFRSRVLAMQG